MSERMKSNGIFSVQVVTQQELCNKELLPRFCVERLGKGVK